MLTPPRALTCFLVSILAAACAGPLSFTQPNAAQAPLPATLPPDEALSAVVTPGPVTLAGSLPLAVWHGPTDRNTLLPVHPLTGQPLDGYDPIDLGQHYAWALAPSGQALALISFPDEHSESNGQLRFVDLAEWTVRDTATTLDGYPGLFQFAPDGRSLLLAETGPRLNTLSRFDAATGERLAQADLGFFPKQVAVTPDGAGLMVYGVASETANGLNPSAHVALLALRDLAPRWQHVLPVVLDGQYLPDANLDAHDDSLWYFPALAWAPGQPRLYVVHASDDTLTTVDFAAQSILSRPIAPAQSWLDRLMALTAGVAEAKVVNGAQKQALLSPAGDRLYVLGVSTATGEYGFTETPLGLSVVDPATGHLLARLDTDARSFNFAGGGHTLILETWGERTVTELRRTLDLETLVRTLPGVRLLSGRLPAGQPLLLAALDNPAETRFQVLDPLTFAALATWSAPGSAMPLLRP
jgi:hypothetical protein